jgi:two-component system, LytTR family, sensor histidine kinase AgrC
MTHIETFIGSAGEAISVIFFLNLFNRKYIESKWKTAVIIMLVSLCTAATEALVMPVQYLINYLLFISLLLIFTKIKLYKVFFEFLLSIAVISGVELLLIFFTSRISPAISLNMPVRLVHLVLIMTLCGLIGTNRTLHIKVTNIYNKCSTQIYLVAGNLFVFAIAELYHWNTDGMSIKGIGIITVIIICWFIINAYLLKILIDNQKEKEKNQIHEQYIEVTENLLNVLYAEKHEYKKHLQVIGGLVQTSEPSAAMADIESYIADISCKEKDAIKQSLFINTGDGIINALLYTKSKEAEQNQTAFYYVPSGEIPHFPCRKYELVEIIGNLIDNAFEYVMTLDAGRRKVFITLSSDDTHDYIEVRNPYFGDENINAGILTKKGYSTKEKTERGYGLYNVKCIVMKYNGRLNLYVEEGQFIVVASF